MRKPSRYVWCLVAFIAFGMVACALPTPTPTPEPSATATAVPTETATPTTVYTVTPVYTPTPDPDYFTDTPTPIIGTLTATYVPVLDWYFECRYALRIRSQPSVSGDFIRWCAAGKVLHVQDVHFEGDNWWVKVLDEGQEAYAAYRHTDCIEIPGNPLGWCGGETEKP